MEQEKVGNKVVSGLVWTFGERICAQLVSTVVTIVLARILDPTHYGVISIVTVFITFFNVFVSGGFGSALVQNKESNEVDFNTAFIMSISTAIALYVVLFFSAPYIANFYENSILNPVIRVMGLRLIVASINNIQQAYIRRKMDFKKFFWATLIGTIISGIIGVFLAINGFGVWALVAQYLINVSIDTIMLFFVGGWFPKLQFSKNSAKKIWTFGWKVLATDLVFTIEGDIRSLVVGKVFGPSDLAFYDQGKKYPALLVTNINASIEKVMLPAFSKKQDNTEILRNALRRSIKTGVYLLAPILIGFAVVGESFVRVILTEKWLESIPYIQIFCIAYLARPLGSSCHQALLAIGKSGIVLVCMVAINLFALIGVIISVFCLKSVLAIAFFSLATEIISFILFLGFTNKYLDYCVKQQFTDVFPSLAVAVIMGIIVWGIGFLSMNQVIVLILQIVVGCSTYICLSAILKLEPFEYIKKTIYKMLKR